MKQIGEATSIECCHSEEHRENYSDLRSLCSRFVYSSGLEVQFKLKVNVKRTISNDVVKGGLRVPGESVQTRQRSNDVGETGQNVSVDLKV